MIGARLSVMMFLQFFIWGCWFVTLGTFLAANFQASGVQTGFAFSTRSLTSRNPYDFPSFACL